MVRFRRIVGTRLSGSPAPTMPPSPPRASIKNLQKEGVPIRATGREAGADRRGRELAGHHPRADPLAGASATGRASATPWTRSSTAASTRSSGGCSATADLSRQPDRQLGHRPPDHGLDDDRVQGGPGQVLHPALRPFVGTSRPETKLGDTAIAVHPDDERYKELVGQTFDIPWPKGPTISVRVVADRRIEPEFGTGMLGVTPAHSPIDFDIAQEHNLPMIQIVGEDGRMTEAAGIYAGLTVAECREAFARDLEEAGLLEKVEAYPQRLRPLPLEAGDRAAPEAPVVHRRQQARRPLEGEAPVPQAGDARGGGLRRDPDPAAARGEDLLPLDRQPPRLVHLAPDLVGAPRPRLVPGRPGDVRRPSWARRRRGQWLEADLTPSTPGSPPPLWT